MRRIALAALMLPALAAPGADRAAAPMPPTAVYLVLPFENTAEDPSLDWLSTGLALSLREYLLGLGAHTVDDEERAVLMEGSGIPAGAPLTLASTLELGRKMRARRGGPRPDRMILGRFNVTDGSLTLQARIVDLEKEKAHSAVVREGRLKDLLDIQAGLALAIARDDGLQHPRQGKSALLEKHAGELPLLAFETYCRAMAASDSKTRLQLLRRAVEEFPGYPKAAFQAASLLAKSERWSDAARMLEKAASDPHPYESDFQLLTATVALARGRGDEASAAARRALDYAPSARAHALLGRALLAQGDATAAATELAAAVALDPDEPDLEDLRRALSEGADPSRRPQ